MVEAEGLGPNTDHAPPVTVPIRSVPEENAMWKSLQQDDSDNDRIEHGLRIELVSLLDPPEAVDADRLSRDADE